MTQLKKGEIDAWNGLVAIAEQFAVGQPLTTAFACRGQGLDCRLLPRLTRETPSELELQDIYDIENNAQSRFESQAHLYLPHSLAQAKVGLTDYMVYMQHYGVPTRLLDWTESIYIAAYFAVSEIHHHESDGVIWYFHISSINEASKAKYGRTGPYTKPFSDLYQEADPKPDLNVMGMNRQLPRLANQQSILTISQDVRRSHDEIIQDLIAPLDSTEILAGKLIVKAEAKSEIHRQLHSANINAATLFPGIDGLGKSVADSVIRSMQIRREEIQAGG